METVRDQIHDLREPARRLQDSRTPTKGLTDLERETVRSFISEAGRRVGPFSVQLSLDAPPLAATLSNIPLID